MLFKPELIDKIVTGQKTQTRRPLRDGEIIKKVDGKMTWFSASGRIKYQVGKTYAVQPGRGLATVRWHPITIATINDVLAEADFVPLRIKILSMSLEDVRDISHEDSLHEGFCAIPKYEFLQTWCSFYDASMVAEIAVAETSWEYREHCPLFLRDRPDELYRGVAIKFEIAL